MKKKLFLLFPIFLITLFSCNSDHVGDLYTKNETLKHSPLPVKSAEHAMSVGELHNFYLDQMYQFFAQQETLNASTINQYAKEFFLTLDSSNLIIENYQYAIDAEVVNYELPLNFKLEIEALDNRLETADFTNLEEFKDFVGSYQPTQITDKDELVIWNYYTDVLSHSVTYWATNLEKWNNLFGITAFSVMSADKPKCKEGNWWKRTWCNVKRYGAVDAGAAVTTAITLYFGPNPVTFMAVAGAGLGASAGAIIKDLIF